MSAERSALFDNRYRGAGMDHRPLSRLVEVSLHNCASVTGDAAFFASLPNLQKLVLSGTKVIKILTLNPQPSCVVRRPPRDKTFGLSFDTALYPHEFKTYMEIPDEQTK
jgi:hypothetical protein